MHAGVNEQGMHKRPGHSSMQAGSEVAGWIEGARAAEGQMSQDSQPRAG
jgi:hypothetical protein